MYILTRILTRPSPDILYPFEAIRPDDQYRQYMEENHPGLVLEYLVEHAEDKLSVTVRTVFPSRNALLNYLCDINCYNSSIKPQIEYSMNNGIVSVSTTETKE